MPENPLQPCSKSQSTVGSSVNDQKNWDTWMLYTLQHVHMDRWERKENWTKLEASCPCSSLSLTHQQKAYRIKIEIFSREIQHLSWHSHWYLLPPVPSFFASNLISTKQEVWMPIWSIKSNDVASWHWSLADLAFKMCPLQITSLCSSRRLVLLAARLIQTQLLS